jgi:hypothetical protein
LKGHLQLFSALQGGQLFVKGRSQTALFHRRGTELLDESAHFRQRVLGQFLK